MQGLDKRVALAGTTSSSYSPRQFLSRSHRAVHGETILFWMNARSLDAQGLSRQGMSAVKTEYCGIEDRTSLGPYTYSGELTIQ